MSAHFHVLRVAEIVPETADCPEFAIDYVEGRCAGRLTECVFDDHTVEGLFTCGSPLPDRDEIVEGTVRLDCSPKRPRGYVRDQVGPLNFRMTRR